MSRLVRVAEATKSLAEATVRNLSASAPAPQQKRKVLVIGNGNMGGAMLKKWHQDPSLDVTVISPRAPSESAMLPWVKYHQSVDAIKGEAFDAIAVAVKPQKVGEILPSYKDKLKKDGIVVSVLAGASLETIGGHFPKGSSVVRAMPNLPATIGKSMTGMIANDQTTERQSKFAEELMSSIGEVLWVKKEDAINAVTAISGSGPAYFFEVGRVFVEAAKDLGFTEEAAKKLVLQTMVGSAELAASSDKSLEDLRKAVTSPQGTTHFGLEKLMEGEKLQQLFKATTEAAYARARELAAIAAGFKKPNGSAQDASSTALNPHAKEQAK